MDLHGVFFSVKSWWVGTQGKCDAFHSRRTALRSVSDRAKKRFPVRVQCRSCHREFKFFIQDGVSGCGGVNVVVSTGATLCRCKRMPPV